MIKLLKFYVDRVIARNYKNLQNINKINFEHRKVVISNNSKDYKKFGNLSR